MSESIYDAVYFTRRLVSARASFVRADFGFNFNHTPVQFYVSGNLLVRTNGANSSPFFLLLHKHMYTHARAHSLSFPFSRARSEFASSVLRPLLPIPLTSLQITAIRSGLLGDPSHSDPCQSPFPASFTRLSGENLGTWPSISARNLFQSCRVLKPFLIRSVGCDSLFDFQNVAISIPDAALFFALVVLVHGTDSESWIQIFANPGISLGRCNREFSHGLSRPNISTEGK